MKITLTNIARPLLLSLLMAMSICASLAQTATILPEGFHSLSGFPYVIITEKGVQSSLALSDSLFDELATGIQFQVNRYDINPASPFVQNFQQQVLPYIKNNDLQLVKLFIRGAASPEGSYQHNQELANKRTEALVNMLQTGDSIRQPIYTAAAAEDYNRLLSLMHQAGDKDYPQVKALYDQLRRDPSTFKARLMANRLLWNRLLVTYFPQLRTARIVLLYKHRDDVRNGMGINASSKALPTAAAIVPFNPSCYQLLEQPSDSALTAAIITASSSSVRRVEQDSNCTGCNCTKCCCTDSDCTGCCCTGCNCTKCCCTDSNCTGCCCTGCNCTGCNCTGCNCTDSTVQRREFMSIKSNVLFDFAYMPGYDRFCPIPNVAVEFYPLRGHFTFGASFDGPWWQHYDLHKYFQVRNYQLHTRFYFRSGSIKKRKPGEGAAFKGPYLSAYVHGGLYSICFDANRGWEGEGWGAGLGAGWVIGLGKRQHWRLELGIQAGYFQTRYDPYQWLCPIQPDIDPQQYYYKWYGKAEDFKERQYRYTWLGPTRIEITLSYDLLYRRVHKRGLSFRAKEKKR